MAHIEWFWAYGVVVSWTISCQDEARLNHLYFACVLFVCFLYLSQLEFVCSATLVQLVCVLESIVGCSMIMLTRSPEKNFTVFDGWDITNSVNKMFDCKCDEDLRGWVACYFWTIPICRAMDAVVGRFSVVTKSCDTKFVMLPLLIIVWTSRSLTWQFCENIFFIMEYLEVIKTNWELGPCRLAISNTVIHLCMYFCHES